LLLLAVPATAGVLVLLVAVLTTLLATAVTLVLARRREAAFAGLLVDVDVALLAVFPAGDPWVGDLGLLLLAAVVLLLAVVGRLLLLLLLLVLAAAAEGVEELFYEAGHFVGWLEGVWVNCVKVVVSVVE